jgi:hypothetical protein
MTTSRPGGIVSLRLTTDSLRVVTTSEPQPRQLEQDPLTGDAASIPLPTSKQRTLTPLTARRRQSRLLRPGQSLTHSLSPHSSGSVGTRLPTFHAEAADRTPAAFMPGTTWPVSGCPPGSSRSYWGAPVSMPSPGLRWFDASPAGRRRRASNPSSPAQHHDQLTRYPTWPPRVRGAPQFPKVPGLIPRSAATWAIGFPVSRTIRTAPSRNSRSNRRRFSGMAHPYSPCLHGLGEPQSPRSPGSRPKTAAR